MADQSNQMYRAGEATGHVKANAEGWVDSAMDKVNAVKDKTGEQIKSMAQGAADSVKSTLGVGDQIKH